MSSPGASRSTAPLRASGEGGITKGINVRPVVDRLTFHSPDFSGRKLRNVMEYRS